MSKPSPCSCVVICVRVPAVDRQLADVVELRQLDHVAPDHVVVDDVALGLPDVPCRIHVGYGTRSRFSRAIALSPGIQKNGRTSKPPASSGNASTSAAMSVVCSVMMFRCRRLNVFS
jgi:hypothetical protein